MSKFQCLDENDLLNKQFIVGSDEVGYGSWAGPLVVVGVRAPCDWNLEGLKDSKKLTRKKREIMAAKLEQLIAKNEISWGLAERSNSIIDKIGLGVSLKDAYIEIFKQLYREDCLIISDGILKFDNPEVNVYDKKSVIKADTQIPHVMAASILAKVYRDNKMRLYDKSYSMYGWDHNVGYIKPDHVEAVKKYGYSPLHRTSYKVKGISK